MLDSLVCVYWNYFNPSFQVPEPVKDVMPAEPQGLVGRLLMKHFNSTATLGSVKCSYCPKTMKFDGSNSTGIERHLKNYHKKEYSVFDKEKKEEKAKAVNINNNIVKGKRRIQETKPKEGQPKMKQSKFSWSIVDKELQKRWDNSIVEYAADSFSSYAQLSSKAFKDLIRVANKLIKVKSRQTLSRHIKKKAINILNRIAKQLKKEKGSLRSLGFTTDMWTSRTGDSFISLTVSYIDQNWKLRRWTPFVKFFPNAHKAVQIKIALDEMIEMLGVENPELKKYAVNDNAANAKAAIRLSNYLIQYLCDNHTLQLGVVDSFKSNIYGAKTAEVLDKSKILSRLTHQSGPALRHLRDACSRLKVKFRKLKNPNETRWNSQYDCMKSTLRLKEPLDLLFAEDPDGLWSAKQITLAEWKLMQGAVEVLEEVEVVTKAWEVEVSPTMNGVLEQIYNLTTKLQEFISSPQKCR